MTLGDIFSFKFGELPVAAQYADEAYLERLRKSKSKPAVLLLEFITQRSRLGDRAIFVFEGVDDKIIYSQWLRQCPLVPEYEPYVCNNKDQVLKLHKSIVYSLTGLNQKVLFFIDRDFDDTKNFRTSDILYMTEMYSVENYIVCARVVEDALKNEFPCHGNPELRKSIVDIFNRLYDEFLSHMDDFNFHIYTGRRLDIEFRGHIPDSLTKFVEVGPQSLTLRPYNPAQILPFMKPVSSSAIAPLRTSYASLSRRERHRGKFAYKFLLKWLAALVEEFNDESSILFRGVDRSRNVRISDLVLSNLASKTAPPAGLCSFVATAA